MAIFPIMAFIIIGMGFWIQSLIRKADISRDIHNLVREHMGEKKYQEALRKFLASHKDNPEND